MVGWHHQLNGHELEQALGVGEGHGSLVVAAHGFAKSQTWMSSWTKRFGITPWFSIIFSS